MVKEGLWRLYKGLTKSLQGGKRERDGIQIIRNKRLKNGLGIDGIGHDALGHEQKLGFGLDALVRISEWML